MLETREEMNTFFRESLRCIKEHGEIRLFPIQLEPKWRSDAWFENLAGALNDLTHEGCIVERRITQEGSTKNPDGSDRPYKAEVLIIRKGTAVEKPK